MEINYYALVKLTNLSCVLLLMNGICFMHCKKIHVIKILVCVIGSG